MEESDLIVSFLSVRVFYYTVNVVSIVIIQQLRNHSNCIRGWMHQMTDFQRKVNIDIMQNQFLRPAAVRLSMCLRTCMHAWLDLCVYIDVPSQKIVLVCNHASLCRGKLWPDSHHCDYPLFSLMLYYRQEKVEPCRGFVRLIWSATWYAANWSSLCLTLVIDQHEADIEDPPLTQVILQRNHPHNTQLLLALRTTWLPVTDMKWSDIEGPILHLVQFKAQSKCLC